MKEKEVLNKLGDIEYSARKMEAIGAFIYETRGDDFDDDGLWFDVATQATGTIMRESEKIQKLVGEIQNAD